MARYAAACGTTHMVVTPHYLPGVYEPDAAKVRSLVAEFRERLRTEGIPLVVLPGCEVFLSLEVPELLSAGQLMTLADEGKYLLVELPVHEMPAWVLEVLFRIRVQGVMPVLAHPERNGVLSERPERLHGFIRRGALVQVNGSSLTGRQGRGAQRAAERWARNGWVHMLGSDAHVVSGSRSLDLRPAFARLERLGVDLALPPVSSDAQARVS